MMHHPESRFVVPIDAGIGLEDKVLKYVKQYGLESRFDGIILDYNFPQKLDRKLR